MKIKETIGIDVSKPFIDVIIHTSQKHRQFPNTAKGFVQMLAWIEKNTKVKSINQMFAFEHTGLYSIPISVFLTEKKIQYVLLPGLEVKKSMGIVRGKNDKLDAKTIALYTYRRRDEIKPYNLPSKNLFELRKLLSLRDKLARQRAGYKTAKKETSSFLKKEDHEVYLDIHEEMIKLLSEEIKKVEKRIREIIKSEKKLQEYYKLITSIKGVGQQTAWYIIVYTNAFTLFKDSRKFASYAGIAPFPYQSGISIKGLTKVNNLANKKLKSLLSNCASSAITHSPEMRLYYHKRLDMGKHKMSTLNIVRNKILGRIFAVVKRGTPYVDTLAYAA